MVDGPSERVPKVLFWLPHHNTINYRFYIVCYNLPMKIIFPELANPLASQAVQQFPDIDFLPASDLSAAVQLLTSGQADTMISGLDYSSRDVLLAYKDQLPLKSKYFSSCFICERGNTHFALADGGVTLQYVKWHFQCIR